MQSLNHIQPLRKIIHIDMDCFFAAVEMRNNPAWQGVALAVGGESNRRGVIATCNYEARKYGVRSAMSTAHALRLCPHLIVTGGNMAHYKEVSQEIHKIFERYTDIIQPLSLDEAWLDVSNCPSHHGSATLIAKNIRHDIKNELGLTASAGIAPNKFLAKIASEENKPDGQFAIPPQSIDNFLKDLALSRINGIGKKTSSKLKQSGLFTCSDILQWDYFDLIKQFGNTGEYLWQRAHGIDNSPVQTVWQRKSLSIEHTWPQDITELTDATSALGELYLKLKQRIANNAPDRVIAKQCMKLKFDDFVSTSIERKSPNGLCLHHLDQLFEVGWNRRNNRGIRLIGIGVIFSDNNISTQQQLSLFQNN